MPRHAKPFTAAFVEKTTRIGRHCDGDGLYFDLRANGAAYWLSRFTIDGKRHEMVHGRARGPGALKLADARVRNRSAQAAARERRNPIEERKAARAKKTADDAEAKAGDITFGAMADMHIAAHEAAWSPKHRAQWRSAVRDHCDPIRDTLVGDVDTEAVLGLLKPLWTRAPETGSRVRGRIEMVLDAAAARGLRNRNTLNPATWRGHLDKLLPKRSKVAPVEHFAALDWRAAAAFMARLRQMTSISARALELLILTAVRSGEVRGARWSEIDLERKVWTIPSERMKGRREHRVPLSESAVRLLQYMGQFGSHPSDLVFPGSRSRSVLSDVVMARALKMAGGDGVTTHGMRSTFRTWAGEMTAHPREVIEMALAHRLGDAAEQAYARGDLFEKRRRLMSDWAAFLSREMRPGEVIEFRRGETG
jgi:integrase